MRELVLDIPYVPPSPNAMRGAHWARARNVRQAAGWAVRCAIPWPGSRVAEKAQLRATIHACGQPGDPDNNLARLKPIIDGLVSYGMLVDDSPRWLEIPEQIGWQRVSRRADAHVQVRLTYLES